jgi:hypothetical protein
MESSGYCDLPTKYDTKRIPQDSSMARTMKTSFGKVLKYYLTRSLVRLKN